MIGAPVSFCVCPGPWVGQGARPGNRRTIGNFQRPLLDDSQKVAEERRSQPFAGKSKRSTELTNAMLAAPLDCMESADVLRVYRSAYRCAGDVQHINAVQFPEPVATLRNCLYMTETLRILVYTPQIIHVLYGSAATSQTQTTA